MSGHVLSHPSKLSFTRQSRYHKQKGSFPFGDICDERILQFDLLKALGNYTREQIHFVLISTSLAHLTS